MTDSDKCKAAFHLGLAYGAPTLDAARDHIYRALSLITEEPGVDAQGFDLTGKKIKGG